VGISYVANFVFFKCGHLQGRSLKVLFVLHEFVASERRRHCVRVVHTFLKICFICFSLWLDIHFAYTFLVSFTIHEYLWRPWYIHLFTGHTGPNEIY